MFRCPHSCLHGEHYPGASQRSTPAHPFVKAFWYLCCSRAHNRKCSEDGDGRPVGHTCVRVSLPHNCACTQCGAMPSASVHAMWSYATRQHPARACAVLGTSIREPSIVLLHCITPLQTSRIGGFTRAYAKNTLAGRIMSFLVLVWNSRSWQWPKYPGDMHGADAHYGFLSHEPSTADGMIQHICNFF